MAVVIGRGITLFSVETATGTLNAANNGLAVSGGTTVQLGGALIKSTTVDGSGNFFFLLNEFNPGGSHAIQIGLQQANSNTLYAQDVAGNFASFSVGEDAGETTVKWQAIYEPAAGGQQYIQSKDSVTGVLGIAVFDTVDNVGLNSSTLFAINNPNQYAQYGNLTPILGTVNTPVEIIGNLFTVYNNTGTKKQLVQVNVSLLVVSVGTGCTFTVQMIYVDGNGTSRTVTLGTASTLTPMIIAPQVLYINSASAIGLQVTFGGTNDGTYQLFADCEFKGVQN